MVVYVDDGANRKGWLGANGQLYSCAHGAHESFWRVHDQLYPEGDASSQDGVGVAAREIVLPPLALVPQEIITFTAFLNEKLWRDIQAQPDRILKLTSRQFEEFVAELFSREGYEVELTPPTWDGGRDIIAVKRAGVCSAKCLAECKHSPKGRSVGVEVLRSLYGVLTHEDATYGILATTSLFTSSAREFVRQHEWRLDLKDYDGLKQWLARVS